MNRPLLLALLFLGACARDPSPAGGPDAADAGAVVDAAEPEDAWPIISADASPDAAPRPDAQPKSDAELRSDAQPTLDATPARDTGTTPDAGPVLPPVNADVDYQLGGPYPPPAGVTVVSRDRQAAPAAGLYNICYVNGFQIQPDEVDTWTQTHPGLMLRDARGQLVIDPDWDEILIDIRTPAQRAELAGVVAGWIQGCRRAGFDAVEIDNLDTYTRARGLLTEDQAVQTMRLFADAAHAQGMAIAQKNSAELVPRRAELGTDFAVVEECNRYQECDVFVGAYQDHVLVIEYRRADFDRGCARYPNLSIILRDLNLVTPSDRAYVYRKC